MRYYETDGLGFYQFDQYAFPCHGVFTRKGGVSAPPFDALNLGGNVGDDPRAVRRNHERMYGALGVDDGRVCTVWQVHSADILLAQSPARGRRWLAAADGLITDRHDTPLAMRFADCTPLLFYDPVRGAVGIAHAGWRGTVQGIAGKMVRALQQAYGCAPRDLRVGIGPSIGPESYQVGVEVVEAVQTYFGTTEGLIQLAPDGTTYFDLWAANALDLRHAGVEQIEIAGISTALHTDKFFSHRKEKGRTGRFGAVISL